MFQVGHGQSSIHSKYHTDILRFILHKQQFMEFSAWCKNFYQWSVCSTAEKVCSCGNLRFHTAVTKICYLISQFISYHSCKYNYLCLFLVSCAQFWFSFTAAKRRKWVKFEVFLCIEVLCVCCVSARNILQHLNVSTCELWMPGFIGWVPEFFCYKKHWKVSVVIAGSFHFVYIFVCSLLYMYICGTLP
jgi:hypothetical protein